MAVLTTQQVLRVYANGISDQVALYAMRKVTTGDTFDLSADFQVAKQAVVLGTTVAGTEAATVTATSVTIPAGLSNDAGYLLVWGAAA